MRGDYVTRILLSKMEKSLKELVRLFYHMRMPLEGTISEEQVRLKYQIWRHNDHRILKYKEHMLVDNLI